MTCIVPPSPPWSGAALLRFCEPRFESIGNTFITFPTCYHADFVAEAGASRRSRSFSHVSLEHVEMQASLSSGESGESTDAAEAHDGTSGTEDTEDGGCTMMLRMEGALKGHRSLQGSVAHHYAHTRRHTKWTHTTRRQTSSHLIAPFKCDALLELCWGVPFEVLPDLRRLPRTLGLFAVRPGTTLGKHFHCVSRPSQQVSDRNVDTCPRVPSRQGNARVKLVLRTAQTTHPPTQHTLAHPDVHGSSSILQTSNKTRESLGSRREDRTQHG